MIYNNNGNDIYSNIHDINMNNVSYNIYLDTVNSTQYITNTFNIADFDKQYMSCLDKNNNIINRLVFIPKVSKKDYYSILRIRFIYIYI